MKQSATLTLTAAQHAALQAHLYPGDGKEAVALVLCGRRDGVERHRIVANEIIPIPHAECAVRTPDRVRWSTDRLAAAMPRVMQKGLAVLKVHSHPGGYENFSKTDDESDEQMFGSVFNWTDSELPHASAIMLPDGRLFGRMHDAKGLHYDLELVTVIGDDIVMWRRKGPETLSPAHALRDIQTFGRATYDHLRHLRVAVVGCSGTGSFVVEQLARLGVGGLVLIDPDVVEYKNLNRVINATAEDAALRRPKVEVMARAVARMGLGTTVATFQGDVSTRRGALLVAECDVVFGCVDSIDGRNVLNRIAAFYLLPYFDVGVRLEADGKGGIDDIYGTVHYVRPDGSSLRDRGVYDGAALEAAGLRRTDAKEYERRIKEGYIRRVAEDRPAVITVNAFYSSLCVNEFLARIHPYRWDKNAVFATYRYSLAQAMAYMEVDGEPSKGLARYRGRGDMTPLLDMPEMSG